MTEPEAPDWRIWAGAGLLAHTPMSDERRAAFEREEERERLAAEREAERRAEAAAEHRAGLLWQGVQPRSVGEVLQTASFAMDRADRREAKREAEGLAAQLHPPVDPLRLSRFELERRQKAREEIAAETPATQADLKRLKAELTTVKGKLFAATGRT